MFNCYKKGDRIIQATELAYKVIYKAQGFVLVGDTKAGDTDGTAGSDSGDSGKAKAVKRSRKPE